MRALGYGRISDSDGGDEETSLPNQRDMIEEYASENGLEIVDWYQDRNVSGKTHPSERNGFQQLMAVLEEREDIPVVLVKNGKRLARGLSADDVKNSLRNEIGREIEFVKTHPEGLERQVDSFKAADEGSTEWAMAPAMEGMKKSFERQEIAQAREQGKLLIARKRSNDQPFHRPPRGVTTDKQKNGKPTSTEWVPIEEYYDDDGARVRHKEFDTCIEMLNKMATTGKSPYQIGKSHGVPNPDRKMKNLWKRRDFYRDLALVYGTGTEIKF